MRAIRSPDASPRFKRSTELHGYYSNEDEVNRLQGVADNSFTPLWWKRSDNKRDNLKFRMIKRNNNYGNDVSMAIRNKFNKCHMI